MKVNEIRDFTSDELELKLSELKAELFNLRFQNSTNQLDNTRRIGEVKKTIARILTIMREKELSNK